MVVLVVVGTCVINSIFSPLSEYKLYVDFVRSGREGTMGIVYYTSPQGFIIRISYS